MQDEIVFLLTPELVDEAASRWGATEKAVLLDDVTNFVYEIKCQQERRILRLTHSSHHSEDEIMAELDWVNYLVQQGVTASRPLFSERNKQLTVCFPVQGSSFTAAVFEYAPGHFIDTSNRQEWNPSLFQTLGRTMGRMHRVTKQYHPRHLKKKRSHWFEEDTIQNASDYLPADQKQVATDLEELLQCFGHASQTVDDYGLVHNDVNPTNFHVNDGRITLFDFDDCAYNWFINDIAVTMPLYSKLFNKAGWEAELKEFFCWYMRGYEQENKLDEGWLEVLPDCLRLQNIITLVACHQSNVPNSQYRSFYEQVLNIYQQGHPLFNFDFYKTYQSQK
jgi:Ser/Thr protein kinase RdoA (MazF antagonist)